MASAARDVGKNVKFGVKQETPKSSGEKNEIFKVPISELVSNLSTQSGIKYLVLDGIITQRLLEGAKNAGIECLIGHRVAKLSNPNGVILKTFSELGLD